MPSSRTFYLIIVCGIFLTAGTACTLATKWADLLDAPDRFGHVSSFEHPFFQTLVMFTGEVMCFVAFRVMVWRKDRKGIPLVLGEDTSIRCNVFLFLIPAAADFTASTLNNVALTLTTASVYQMLRGSTVLFTAIFSFIFLKRRFFRHEYLGILLVVVGLTIVGVSASLKKPSSSAAKNPVLGNILVIVAQVVQSSQFVVEESIIKSYKLPPMYLVGCEGLFGLGLSLITLAVFQAFASSSPDDAVVAFEQIGSCWRCGVATLVLLSAIPLFNGAAVTVTKELSAATRMILDAMRNISVWSFTMLYSSFFHEEFDWLQLVGFFFLVLGSTIYKEILKIPHPFFHVPDELREVLKGEGSTAEAGYASLDGTDDDGSRRRHTEMSDCRPTSADVPDSPLQKRESISANM